MQGSFTVTRIAVALGAAVGLSLGNASAADWQPDQPITIIVPWAAGGSTDQMARIVATELESELKQKVVVVNQPGASGSVGTKGVLEGAPEGTRVLSTDHAANPARRRVRWDYGREADRDDPA